MEKLAGYRYPGSRPFQDTCLDRLLFKGREYEKQSLTHLVLAEDLIVIFAKSGMGKTSLLNAGLLQLLREKDFIPLTARFNDSGIDPLQSIYSGIKETIKRSSYEYEYTPGEENTLWQYFKTVEFWYQDNLLTPLLILDQFEDFFTFHPPERRKMLITQVADLIRGRVPKCLLESLKPDEQFSYSEKPPNVKIVISIREDYLGKLEEMSREIPDILHNRFRLIALNREQARQAITEPAQLTDERINTRRFSFDTEAVGLMLDFLCKRKEGNGAIVTDEIEPFQLQLLCQHLENKVYERPVEEGAEITVRRDDLDGEVGMRQVLQDFYDTQIKRLGAHWKKRRVRRLCERGLINGTNRRLSLEEGEVERKFKVSKTLLNELVDSRLLRSEPRVGSVYYELSHDTLVEPIRKSQRRRKSMRAKVSGAVLSVCILIFIIIAYRYQTDVDRIYEKAEKLRTEEKKPEEAAQYYQEAIAIDKNFVNAYRRLARLFIDQGRLDEAIQTCRKAIDNTIKDAVIYSLLGDALDKQGSVLDEQGNLDGAIKSYKEAIAIKSYKEAIRIDPNSAHAYISMGNIYRKRKEFKEAIKNYESALKIDSKNVNAYKGLGIFYINEGELEKAIGVYQRALKANVEYAYIYVDLFNVLKEKGMPEKAAQILEIASKVDSKDASHYLNLGYVFSNYLEEYDKAKKNYEKAIQLDPKSAYAYNGLGSVFRKLKGYDEAKKNCEKAIQIDPNFTSAYYSLVAIFFDLKRYDEAIKNCEKAIQIDPDFAPAYNGLGAIFIELHDYQKARRFLERAYSLSPETTLIKANLAELRLITGDYREALDLAKQILKERDIPAYNKLSMKLIAILSLLFQEKREDALAELKEFIKEYQSVTEDYQNSGSHVSLKEFIIKNKKLSNMEIGLILTLIDILESSKPEGEKKLRENEPRWLEIIAGGTNE